MAWFLVSQIFSTLISLIQIGRMSESDKDLEIMVLRYQLVIAERKMQKPVKANRAVPPIGTVDNSQTNLTEK